MATTEIWTFRGDVRSDADLTGFEVEAKDGTIGSVDEATKDLGASYVVVDTGPWIFGKRVLLPAGVVERIDRDGQRIVVNRTRDEIKNAPEYDAEAGADAIYRQQLTSYYGRAEKTQAASRSRARTSRSRSSTSRKRATSTRSRSQARSSSGRKRRTTQGRSRTSDGPTKEELYAQAKRLNIEGRSKMDKSQLARAVGRKRGGSSGRSTSPRGQAKSSRSRRGTSSGARRAKANPVEVQAFLDGVSYPTRKGDLLREAERSGARREVRTTLERLPEERFTSPTEVSEAIGKLR